MGVSETQIGVRIPKTLRQRIAEKAKRGEWGISAQVRYDLEEIYGIPHRYLPAMPNHEDLHRKND